MLILDRRLSTNNGLITFYNLGSNNLQYNGLRTHYIDIWRVPSVGMSAGAHFIGSLIHVTIAVRQRVQNNEVKVHFFNSISIFCFQLVSTVVLPLQKYSNTQKQVKWCCLTTFYRCNYYIKSLYYLSMVHNKCCRRSTLVFFVKD